MVSSCTPTLSSFLPADVIRAEHHMGSSLDFSGWLCIQAVCKFPGIWILHKVGKFVFQVLYFPPGEWLFSFASSPNTLLSSMNWLFHSYCAKGSLNPPNKPGWLAAADFRLGLVWNGVWILCFQVSNVKWQACCWQSSENGLQRYRVLGGFRWHAHIERVWHRVSPWGIAEARIPTLNTLHLNCVHKSVFLFWATFMLENLPMSLDFGFLKDRIGIMIPTSQGCCEDWKCSTIFMLGNYGWKASFKHALAM